MEPRRLGVGALIAVVLVVVLAWLAAPVSQTAHPRGSIAEATRQKEGRSNDFVNAEESQVTKDKADNNAAVEAASSSEEEVDEKSPELSSTLLEEGPDRVLKFPCCTFNGEDAAVDKHQCFLKIFTHTQAFCAEYRRNPSFCKSMATVFSGLQQDGVVCQTPGMLEDSLPVTLFREVAIPVTLGTASSKGPSTSELRFSPLSSIEAATSEFCSKHNVDDQDCAVVTSYARHQVSIELNGIIRHGKLLASDTRYVSQVGQDEWVLENVYHLKTQGYAIEIGAADGITHSNTYSLERGANWLTVCIEPSSTFDELVTNRPLSTRIRACVYSVGDEEVEFEEDIGLSHGGMLSGISKHVERLRGLQVEGNVVTYTMKTTTAGYILEASKAPAWIDYLSIDTEGVEAEILKGVPFERFSAGVVSLEHNKHAVYRQALFDALTPHGYTRMAVFEQDDMYVFEGHEEPLVSQRPESRDRLVGGLENPPLVNDGSFILRVYSGSVAERTLAVSLASTLANAARRRLLLDWRGSPDCNAEFHALFRNFAERYVPPASDVSPYACGCANECSATGILTVSATAPCATRDAMLDRLPNSAHIQLDDLGSWTDSLEDVARVWIHVDPANATKLVYSNVLSGVCIGGTADAAGRCDAGHTLLGNVRQTLRRLVPAPPVRDVVSRIPTTDADAELCVAFDVPTGEAVESYVPLVDTAVSEFASRLDFSVTKVWSLTQLSRPLMAQFPRHTTSGSIPWDSLHRQEWLVTPEQDWAVLNQEMMQVLNMDVIRSRCRVVLSLYNELGEAEHADSHDQVASASSRLWSNVLGVPWFGVRAHMDQESGQRKWDIESLLSK